MSQALSFDFISREVHCKISVKQTKYLRMCEQWIPGCFSAALNRPGNKATPRDAEKGKATATTTTQKGKATQHNSPDSHFSNKNWLPQVYIVCVYVCCMCICDVQCMYMCSQIVGRSMNWEAKQNRSTAIC